MTSSENLLTIMFLALLPKKRSLHPPNMLLLLTLFKIFKVPTFVRRNVVMMTGLHLTNLRTLLKIGMLFSMVVEVFIVPAYPSGKLNTGPSIVSRVFHIIVTKGTSTLLKLLTLSLPATGIPRSSTKLLLTICFDDLSHSISRILMLFGSPSYLLPLSVRRRRHTS